MQYALQRAGYHTVLFGKLLNSWGLKDPPYFDTWALYNGSEKSYIDAKWNIQGTVQFIDQYATRFIGDRTVSFLRSPPSSPWFLYLSVPNPHTPYIAEEQYANAAVPPWSGNPAVFESDRTDKPPYVQEHRSGFSRGNETRTAQLRTLMSVDDMVDRVMTTLRDTGQLDNTLIFFLSDNGYLWSDHGLFGKRYPYLPSIQVPMFVRWDGHLASGAVDDRLVANIDIAPTVYDAAGITPPVTADGHSLLSPYARDRLLFEYWVDAGVPTWASLVTTAGQYIETYDDAGNPSFVEFYDLARDPWELENTGVAPAGWAAQLAADRTCAGASCP
jgi:arylsulfatase A-like enzyme